LLIAKKTILYGDMQKRHVDFSASISMDLYLVGTAESPLSDIGSSFDFLFFILKVSSLGILLATTIDSLLSS
jgi:hypothetical protein